MRGLLTCFGRAFAEPQTYDASRPGEPYLRRLLGRDEFIALVAMDGNAVIGGLAAYVLEKFEQERSEIFIYDLAVSGPHRRRGIATTLIEALRDLAAGAKADTIFVQAAADDAPAVSFYLSLGLPQEVLHFEVGVALTR